MKRVLITICGRAGSKGFKNKNLKVFCGEPLSFYSLSAAHLFAQQHTQDVKVDICLNTDSDLLIEAICEKYPDITVVRRPEELCGDVVPKMAVYQHSLAEMEKRQHCTYDYLIDLDITSPLRQAHDVSGAYAVKIARPDLDLVFSVAPSRRTPYMNMCKLVDDHVERVIEHHFTARQQTPPVFDLNASIYVFERRFLVENETAFLWDGKCGMYQMMDTGIIDIDSEEDYLLMEAIAAHLYSTMPTFAAVRENIRK
ncbi:MAG: acylneuraminate cytidylyltransferase family protein [Oscillospiraceae bacterium]|nr:acylneuraminate cytidylyltransferase family protein [Oscillospiraceae bacterium]